MGFIKPSMSERHWRDITLHTNKDRLMSEGIQKRYWRDITLHTNKDHLMSESIQKRLPIDSLKTLVGGAGMGVDLCHVLISSIETGRVIKTETHSARHKSPPADAHSKILSMVVDLVFEYKAGYFIGGTFRYQSLTSHDYNFDRLEDCISYTRDGVFKFGGENVLGDTSAFRYFWIQVNDNDDKADRALLGGEVARVGGIKNNEENSYEKTAYMRCMSGGLFHFYDSKVCEEVACRLVRNIDPNHAMRYHDADWYHFDDEFVAKIDSKVREAMRVALEAHF